MAQPGIYLGSYSFAVTRHGEPQVLSDLPRGGFITWAKRYIGRPGLRGHNSLDGSRHECEGPKLVGDHTLYGRVHSGESGWGSRFVNAETGEAEWQRTPGTAELIPFYFQIYAPLGAATGVLVLQRFGMRSPYSFFRDELKGAFGDDHDGLSLQFKPYVAKQVLQRLQGGIVSEIKFTSARPPRDLSDFVNRHGVTTGDFYFETRIVAKRERGINISRQLSRLLDKVRNRETAETPAEWRNYGDEVRIVLNRGKNKRTIALGTNREFHPYEDVSSRVQRDSSAHPKLASIHELANEVIYDVRDELRIPYAG